MVKLSARMGAVLGTLLLSVGCAGRAVPEVDNSDRPYRIGREDVLDVAVWRDGDLSRTVPVRPDGFITLPLVGEVQAAGKTPGELEEELKQKLAPFVQEPKLTVIVREVNSSRVFITGEVTNPGAFPLRGRVSLVQAIALAGGFTAFADKNAILLSRTDEKGTRIPVSYGELVRKDASRELILRPGDTVVVP